MERDGDDLHVAVELTMTQAALGTSLNVSGPVGEIEVEIPAGTQPGDVRILRGQGMPSLEGRRRGNFHVHARVHVPRHLDDEQRTLVEQLGQALGEESYRDDETDDGLFGRIRNAFR
jgi:molecular chaperone DnaJ